MDKIIKLNKLIKIAERWRKVNKEYEAGVVLIWGSKAYGWKDQLRDPHQERPGAIAVDAAGQVFEAQGGDDYNGAKCWIRMKDSGVVN
ncbi:antirestriction protein ArdR [Dickeya zeae]|uniref:antirestriction protein ArdR n=1 Tax=Dickeya zeae TaxID=204042 RepID=UPI001CF3786F|nr:antirestriction protein ArdR [Dickeya zeae]MCA6985459.1 antirestriction protein ArdR [Dickeya zeae]